MESYETLTEAISALRKQGYVEDFNLRQDYLEHNQRALKVFAHEFVVDKFFRFENNTDPSDQSILYAISSNNHAIKGLLVNAYGVYASPVTNEIMERLHMREEE